MTSAPQPPAFSLSADQQLCLAYASSAARQRLTALFAVDQHLEQIALGVREPMVARIKLAWWREHGFARGVGDLASELAILADASDQSVPFLCRMAEGWDALLAVADNQAVAMDEYAEGRGAAMFELAALLAGKELTSVHANIGSAWAVTDLSARHPDPTVAARLEAEARRHFSEIDRSSLKALPLPLGILAILARSDATRGARKRWRAGSPMRIGRAALFALTRI